MSSTSSIKTIYVLRGQGIECEKETLHFFSRIRSHWNCSYLDFCDLDRRLEDPYFLDQRTLVVIPGGFSFADHFGSGRLFQYQLAQRGFFKKVLQQGAHILGICNGFQVLCEARFFGEHTRLRPNLKTGHSVGFINRWVSCKSPLLGEQLLRLTVRHGEGRLTCLNGLPFLGEVVLRYQDSQFENGSKDQIAGLMVDSRHGQWSSASTVWGMMPHPEIAFNAGADPAYVPLNAMPSHRKALMDMAGDGRKFIESILGRIEEKIK